MPCVRARVATDETTDRRVLGLDDDDGVDWRLVRISSSGEATDDMNVLAVIPATRGVRGDGVKRRGKTECRR